MFTEVMTSHVGELALLIVFVRNVIHFSSVGCVSITPETILHQYVIRGLDRSDVLYSAA